MMRPRRTMDSGTKRKEGGNKSQACSDEGVRCGQEQERLFAEGRVGVSNKGHHKNGRPTREQGGLPGPVEEWTEKGEGQEGRKGGERDDWPGNWTAKLL